MYGYPVYFPAFSNREDFLLPVKVKDENTGDLINWAGVTGSGTFAAWTVQAGTVLTTSVTPITIPAYPFSSELSALALTVPTGLAIVAGNPITLTDASGANTMQGFVTSYSSTTGKLVAQIGCTFQFEIRAVAPFPRGGWDDGYAPWAAIGIYDRAALLTASLANGQIMFLELGVIQVRIPESMFRQLCLGTYLASLVVTDSQDTRQVFIAQLPLLYGGVTQ